MLLLSYRHFSIFLLPPPPQLFIIQFSIAFLIFRVIKFKIFQLRFISCILGHFDYHFFFFLFISYYIFIYLFFFFLNEDLMNFTDKQIVLSAFKSLNALIAYKFKKKKKPCLCNNFLKTITIPFFFLLGF